MTHRLRTTGLDITITQTRFCVDRFLIVILMCFNIEQEIYPEFLIKHFDGSLLFYEPKALISLEEICACFHAL